MNDSLSFQQLQLLFYRYKESAYYQGSIFIGIIIVCIILCWLVILPQATKWFSIQNEVNATKERIKAIQGNIQLLSSLRDEDLEQNQSIIASALPSEKDFVGILNTISQSAITSGISLSDYTFDVGQLNKLSVQKEASAMPITLSVSGTASNISDFIRELLERLPISEVTKWDETGSAASVTVVFYYKVPPEIPLDDTKPLTNLTPKSTALLQTLQTWQEKNVDLSQFSGNTGSDSALQQPPF